MMGIALLVVCFYANKLLSLSLSLSLSLFIALFFCIHSPRLKSTTFHVGLDEA